MLKSLHTCLPICTKNVQVLIIGAGISGIAVAKKLNDIGLTGYTILEQGADLGGTWYWNKVENILILHKDSICI